MTDNEYRALVAKHRAWTSALQASIAPVVSGATALALAFDNDTWQATVVACVLAASWAYRDRRARPIPRLPPATPKRRSGTLSSADPQSEETKQET